MMDRTNEQLEAQRLSALMDGELDAVEADRACAGWAAEAGRRGCWHAYHVIGDVLRSEELGCAAQDEAFLQRLRGALAKEPAIVAPSPLGLGGREAAAEGLRGGAVAGAPVVVVRRRARWTTPVGIAAGLAAVAATAYWLQPPLAGSVAGEALLARGTAPQAVASGVIPPAAPMAVAAAGSALPAAPGNVPAAPSAQVEGATPGVAVAVAAGAESAVAAEPQELRAETAVLRNPMIDRYLSAHKGVAGATALGPSANFIRSATFEAPAR
jgi:sigma-E factor negative regulatory protein RseA